MSDSIPPRTEQDVLQEYGRVCAQAGELNFHISKCQVDVLKLNDAIALLTEELKDMRISTPTASPTAPEETPNVQSQG
jgi:hypothetical protein